MIKEFQIKDLDKAKTIIKWEITRDMDVRTLKNDRKKYISDFLETEKMISFYGIIPSIKAGYFIFMDPACNYNSANFTVY